MKVRDVVKQLLEQDQDAEAHIAFAYGDHWNTEVAPKIGYVGPSRVIHSDYHRMDKVVDENADEDPKARNVVIVSAS